jgi:thioredoxin-like negative regulator of GroEL
MDLPSFSEWTADALEERSRNAGMPVLVVFWSEQGTPDDGLAAILETVAKKYAGRVTFAQIEAHHPRGLAGALEYPDTPAVSVLDGPTRVAHRAGVAPLWVYEDMLDRALIAYIA